MTQLKKKIHNENKIIKFDNNTNRSISSHESTKSELLENCDLIEYEKNVLGAGPKGL